MPQNTVADMMKEYAEDAVDFRNADWKESRLFRGKHKCG